MKKTIYILLCVALCHGLSAQTFQFRWTKPDDVSTDQAIAMMKASAKNYLTGKYTAIDATGIDQYVDAEILKVYSFSDFSIGAVLPELRLYLEAFHKIKDDADKVEEQDARMLRYAEEYQTRIVAYAAKVDYNGITKYKEKVPMTKLMFFDWAGQVIGVRDDDYIREKFIPKLSGVAMNRIAMSLAAEGDPLFNIQRVWASDVKERTKDGVKYEMFWAAHFFPESIEKNEERGRAHFTYYQYSKGYVDSRKVITIETDYILEGGKIEFGYHISDVTFYSVDENYKDDWDMVDVCIFSRSKLLYSTLNNHKNRQTIRDSQKVPAVFEFKGQDCFRLSDPITPSETYTFTVLPMFYAY